MKRMRHARLILVVLATAAACGALVLRAGGPLVVGGGQGGFSGVAGLPFVWSTTSPVGYYTDLGTLGVLNKTAADTFTADSFNVWQNVTTATIAYTKVADLAQDVTGSNWLSLRDNASSDINTFNAIIYDTDGSVTDAQLGAGASNDVLGFAGPQAVSSDGMRNTITRARAVLNGKFIDGVAGTEVAQDKFKEVIIHEFGHFSGLEHSQINVEVLNNLAARTADNLAGLPNMFPVVLNTAARPTLAPDDIAAISELYPDPSFASPTGRIKGRIFFSDGTTQAQGFNVIARQVSDGNAANGDESRRVAVSSVSGFLFTVSRGNPVVSGSSSLFGARCDPAVAGQCDTAPIGSYDISGLAPGNYTIEVEEIDLSFVDASRVGPIGTLGFQFPLPGPAEFYSGLNETGSSSTDPPSNSTPVAASAGGTVTDINILLNDTPPRFDAWETAWLILSEPEGLALRPPLWARMDRRPAGSAL